MSYLLREIDIFMKICPFHEVEMDFSHFENLQKYFQKRSLFYGMVTPIIRNCVVLFMMYYCIHSLYEVKYSQETIIIIKYLFDTSRVLDFANFHVFWRRL